jgi:hypothetical protein
MDKLEPQIEEITHLPYMQWDQWITSLNNFKYAVHLNPNTIGGTFHLNCAYLGIPCIGNIKTNTQRLCFPDLSVEPYDLVKAKSLIKRLVYDKEFYTECSNKAKKLYQEKFYESIYIKTWEKIKSHL